MLSYIYINFSADFSLVDWMASHSIDQIENIRPPQASELLLQLGLDHFLSEPEKCTLIDDKYKAVDLNGWNNGMLFNKQCIFFLCKTIFLYIILFIDSIHIFSSPIYKTIFSVSCNKYGKIKKAALSLLLYIYILPL